MYFHANPDEFIEWIEKKWPGRIKYLQQKRVFKTWHIKDYLEIEAKLKKLIN